MFLNKLNLYYQTLNHVKPTQLYHQVYYRLRNRISGKEYKGTPTKTVALELEEGLYYPLSYKGNGKFSFLNLEKKFSDIDWNFNEYGKLWTYNLNYFEFLNQKEITKEEGLKLIEDFISFGEKLKDGLEPYPISLRGINWIKFLSRNKIENPEINEFLFRDYQRLVNNLEYHLLANHLLENGFSLLFGAYYFQDEKLYAKAKKILRSELREQILSDGAHYELSPMYHQIILHRVLDCYNLVKNNSWKGRELLPLLKEKAERMLGWLQEISFSDGSFPKLNDAADGIAPTTTQLSGYAENLGSKNRQLKLSDSGYRKFADENFEVIMDVGQISPTYQPGHSHADSLQFVLSYKDKPIIIDTGISTYEKNERRQLERSTNSHNTVTVDGFSSSRVWGGFRVAERAKVHIKKDSETFLEASHNGYRKLGITHQRTFEFTSGIFQVDDALFGNKENRRAEGNLHFHPDVQLKINNSRISINKELDLHIAGASEIRLEEYQFAEAFNKLRPSKKIIYQFTNKAKLLCHATPAAETLRTPREKI